MTNCFLITEPLCYQSRAIVGYRGKQWKTSPAPFLRQRLVAEKRAVPPETKGRRTIGGLTWNGVGVKFSDLNGAARSPRPPLGSGGQTEPLAPLVQIAARINLRISHKFYLYFVYSLTVLLVKRSFTIDAQ